MQKPYKHTLPSEERAVISRSILGVVAFCAATLVVCVILSRTPWHSGSERSRQTIASSNVDPFAPGMPLP